MTPEEKAWSLVNKMLPHARIIVEPGEEVGREKHAKQCALIAVEEILDIATQILKLMDARSRLIG
jgi:hypothetical protein